MVEVAERYRIDALLGRGGFGAVYRAWDHQTERPVAIKLLDGRTDAVAQARFEREWRVIRGLRSPYACTLLDVGRAPDGRRFVVTRLIEGRTLAEVFRDGPVAPARLARWGAQIAEALAEAHASGIVHRDLKPSNVMIEAIAGIGEPVARVLDFGIAGQPESDLTDSAAVLGTARYVAPEVWQGGAHTPASDLYQLGLLLHEGLSGAPTFRGPPPAVMRAHLMDQPAPLDGTPAPLAALVAALLDKAPGARPPSAQAVRARLLGLETPAGPGAPEPLTETGSAPLPRPLARAPRRWIGAGVLALIGAITWALWPDAEAPPVLADASIDAAPPDAAPDAARPADATPADVKPTAPIDAGPASDAAPPSAPPSVAPAPRSAPKPASLTVMPPTARVRWADGQCTRSPCRLPLRRATEVAIGAPGYIPQRVTMRPGQALRVTLDRITTLDLP